MKYFFNDLSWKAFLSLFVVISVISCAQSHYVELNGDSLALFYSDSSAQMVLFASSLDNFKYHPARRSGDDGWRVQVSHNDEFEYFYIVDGVVTIPDCKNTVMDDFGSKNCLYVK